MALIILFVGFENEFGTNQNILPLETTKASTTNITIVLRTAKYIQHTTDLLCFLSPSIREVRASSHLYCEI